MTKQATSSSRLALSRINLRDSLVMQETADIFVANVTQFAQADPADAHKFQEAVCESLESAYGIDASSEDRKVFIFQDGVAIIPVHGALINRFAYCWGFVTGYQYVRRMMNAALGDDDVQLIVFDVDSPGGESAGCFELANEIRESRDIKPSLAVVDALSASAGYAIASAATRMVATPSSRIGSIGVYRMHIDVSGAMDQAGVKITFIEAPEGGQKTAGHPFAPLSPEARKDAQHGVNRTYDDFVELVGNNRDLTDEEIRSTEARVFRADEALALSLIDEVQTPSEAVSSFLAELADEEPSGEEDEDMNARTQKPSGTEATSGAATAAAPAVAAPASAAAPAPAAPAAPAVDQSSIQEAIREDRQRMAAVKALPEAATRPKLAEKLALDGMTADQAKGILECAGEETAATGAATTAATGVDQTNHLETAMDKSKHPNVGAGAESGADGAGGEPKSDADIAASILSDQGAVVGRNYGAKPAA